MKFLFIILVYIGLSCYVVFSWGVVSHTMYEWFIIPNFSNLPHFTVLQFIGFNIFVSVITHKQQRTLNDEYIDKNFTTFMIFFSPWITLFTFWMVKLLIF